MKTEHAQKLCEAPFHHVCRPQKRGREDYGPSRGGAPYPGTSRCAATDVSTGQKVVMVVTASSPAQGGRPQETAGRYATVVQRKSCACAHVMRLHHSWATK